MADTISKPSDTPAAVAEPAAIASVQLRAAASMTQFRILAAIYLGLMAYAWLPGAVVAAFLLPLFCVPTHPRRALWLWTAGILAGGMSIMTSRKILFELGGLGGAFDKDPTWAGIGIAFGVVGALLILWKLSWVKSPRRM